MLTFQFDIKASLWEMMGIFQQAMLGLDNLTYSSEKRNKNFNPLPNTLQMDFIATENT